LSLAWNGPIASAFATLTAGAAESVVTTASAPCVVPLALVATTR
jgi:hypothetical protein